MKAAAPRDPKTHCRLFGYLVAYLSSIYGHRSGVLTRMRVKEVQDAIGDSEKGYLINLMEHKTVRKFGVAQVYLESDEYGWCREWLCLRLPSLPQNSYFFTSFGRGEPKDLIKYFRQAWGEMGLPGSPSLTDIRSAVATYNLETNHSEVRRNMSEFMCHDVHTCGAHKSAPQDIATGQADEGPLRLLGPAGAFTRSCWLLLPRSCWLLLPRSCWLLLPRSCWLLLPRSCWLLLLLLHSCWLY
ncbi:uncharacterized protein LOC115529747 [Gadus morhua]|uniref:uncharacterized protein LOC115529747 n=1 Tax=Gadus morhua TaxID=8049 RepID=UPI0011B5A40B|nr:uncharacterized protein LOC115529747 [Gadus morhua]XP_030194641.1 uncharacterized protein LOC115529747 [Gadus morhua]XP_030194642.1 uncharacterized protein LOC115529747 [Gadus morhua]XP_030194643.1 uncharacterized protein LOC115529747 [Gadus morhua]